MELWVFTAAARNREVQPDGEWQSRYPPDVLLPFPDWLTFTRLLVAVTLILAVVDVTRGSLGQSPIPHDYPFFVGIAYVLGIVWVLRRAYRIVDQIELELVDIHERTHADEYLHPDSKETPVEDIKADMDKIITHAFHPLVLLGGAVIGGVFAVLVMSELDVLSAYPYVLMNFAYGAAHGLFYGPLLAAVYFVYVIPSSYISNIDIMDPDGMGGYRRIGDGIITLITYGVIFATIDFVILSSVSFTGNTTFSAAVFVLYGLMLGSFLVLTVAGVFLIRRRLLAIRDRRTRAMRERFSEIEARFWEKQQRGETPEPEATEIQTMQTMFDQMYGMDLWPINLISLSRLAFSVGSSLVVAAYKAGYVSLPIAL